METESGRLRYVQHRFYLSMTLSESYINGNGGLPINGKLFSFKLLWILSCFEVEREWWKYHGVHTFRGRLETIFGLWFRSVIVCYSFLSLLNWRHALEQNRRRWLGKPRVLWNTSKNLQSKNIIPELYHVDDHGKEEPNEHLVFNDVQNQT